MKCRIWKPKADICNDFSTKHCKSCKFANGCPNKNIETKTVQTDDEEFIKMLVNQRVTFIPKNDDIKAIQRDAVINFAERVKDNLRNVAKVEIMGCEYYLIGLPFIDNLVNEMFGNPEQVKGEENG